MTPGPQLRDIHLPSDPSWWPPAPGWWLLAAIVLIVVFVALRWLLGWMRERRWRRRVAGELDRIAAAHAARADNAQLAAHVSQLLRRVGRLIQPDSVALSDQAWLGFLDQQWPESRASRARFRDGAGRALVDVTYRRDDDPLVQELDANALLDLTRDWLSVAVPRGRTHA